MDIIVCIKQVPGTTQVKINPDTGTLIRDGVEALVNPFDEYAIEEAPLDRSQAAINTFYPEIRARKLKGMYAKNHPLQGLDTVSFGRQTEQMKDPHCPK